MLWGLSTVARSEPLAEGRELDSSWPVRCLSSALDTFRWAGAARHGDRETWRRIPSTVHSRPASTGGGRPSPGPDRALPRCPRAPGPSTGPDRSRELVAVLHYYVNNRRVRVVGSTHKIKRTSSIEEKDVQRWVAWMFHCHFLTPSTSAPDGGDAPVRGRPQAWASAAEASCASRWKARTFGCARRRAKSMSMSERPSRERARERATYL